MAVATDDRIVAVGDAIGVWREDGCFLHFVRAPALLPRLGPHLQGGGRGTRSRGARHAP